MNKKTLAVISFVSLLFLTAHVPAFPGSEDLAKYAGTYVTAGEDSFTIAVNVDDGSLNCTVADGEPRSLTRQSPTRFVFDGSSDWIEFQIESDEVTGLTLYMDGQAHEAKKQ